MQHLPLLKVGMAMLTKSNLSYAMSYRFRGRRDGSYLVIHTSINILSAHAIGYIARLV